MPELSIRIDFGPEQRIGPGKILLLEKIAELGSIAAGGRALGMSYRRAWELINDVNTIFGQPVVASRTGGLKGGGASITDFGLRLIQRYRAMEQKAVAALAMDLDSLLNDMLVGHGHSKRK